MEQHMFSMKSCGNGVPSVYYIYGERECNIYETINFSKSAIYDEVFQSDNSKRFLTPPDSISGYEKHEIVEDQKGKCIQFENGKFDSDKSKCYDCEKAVPHGRKPQFVDQDVLPNKSFLQMFKDTPVVIKFFALLLIVTIIPIYILCFEFKDFSIGQPVIVFTTVDPTSEATAESNPYTGWEKNVSSSPSAMPQYTGTTEDGGTSCNCSETSEDITSYTDNPKNNTDVKLSSSPINASFPPDNTTSTAAEVVFRITTVKNVPVSRSEVGGRTLKVCFSVTVPEEVMPEHAKGPLTTIQSINMNNVDFVANSTETVSQFIKYNVI